MKFSQRAVLIIASKHRLMKLVMPLLLMGMFVTAGAQPAITSVSPVNGNPGSIVTIAGSGFSSTAGNNIVFFGTTRATVAAATTASLQVTVPDGSSYKQVSVLNSGNGLMGYSPLSFLASYNNAAFVSGAVNFASSADFATGSSPFGLATGDFDGDGKTDFVCTNASVDNISVYRNVSTIGTCSVSAQQTYTTSSAPFRLTVGDIDGDGKLDIAVPNMNSPYLSLYRNTSTTGSISFTPVVLTLVNGMSSLALADIDGDGRTDIVIAQRFYDRVEVLRNTGSPGVFSFDNAVTFTTPDDPYDVSVGDMDGDGRPDLAVANNGDASISVFRNTSSSGSITMDSRQDLAVPATGNYAVKVDDLNGDGRNDLVALNYLNNALYIFRGTGSTGSISFDTRADLATGSSPAECALGDYNGDGRPDIAIANQGMAQIQVRLNNSATTSIGFSAAVNFSALANGTNIVAADIDGDGKTDIASVHVITNKLSLFRNDPLGQISGAASVAVSGTTTLSNSTAGGSWSSSNTAVATVSATGVVTGVAAGTVTITYSGRATTLTAENSATKAIIVTSQPVISSFSPAAGYPGSTVTISGSGFDAVKTNNIVFFGQVKATVTSATATTLQVTVPTGFSFGSISVLNATNSLVGYSNKYFVASYNNAPYEPGKVNFATRIDSATAAFPNASRMADFDGDGKVDVVGPSFNGGSIYVYQNTGSPGTISFASRITLTASGGPFKLEVGDLDGDGKPDIAVPCRSANTVTLFRNTSTAGAISFAAAVVVSVTGGPSSIAIDDVDGDGKADIVVARQSINKISVFRGAGTVGPFSLAASTDMDVVSAPQYVTTCDIDGDGQPDIASCGYASSSQSSVFRNKSTPGNIVMAARQTFPCNDRTTHIAFADLDGDSRAEMMITELDNNVVSVYKNTSAPDTISFDAAMAINTNSLPADLGVADFDGDGKVDIVVGNSGNNNMSLLINTSSGGSISFASRVDFAAPTGTYGTSTGDLDGDGLPDIAVACQSSNKISFFRNSPLSAITGSSAVCIGQVSALSNAGSGGTWTSSNTSVATVDAVSGMVTGVAAGSVTITYCGTAGTSFSANRVTKSVTVNARPAITFTAQPSGVYSTSVAVTYTTQGGMTGYTWTIPGTAGVNYAITGGSTASNSITLQWYTPGSKAVTINYTNASGCAAMTAQSSNTITVFARPVIASVSPIVAAGGATVTIGGSNFGATTANNIVYFGAVRATVLSASTTSLLVAVPQSATFHQVSVLNTVSGMVGYSREYFLLNYNNSGYAPGVVNFDAHIDSATGASPNALAAGDFDNDGRPDLVGANFDDNNIYVYRNSGSSGTVSFSSRITLAGSTTNFKLTCGDLDGDGKLDIAIPSRIAGNVTLYRNTSTGSGDISFAAAVTVAVSGAPSSVAIGDIDGDGRADLVTSNNVGGHIAVLRNVGTVGTFSLATAVQFSAPSAPYMVTVGDVDGDKLPDIVCVNRASPGSIYLFRNTSTPGSISMDTRIDLTTKNNPGCVRIVDVDGDGKADLASADASSANISIFRNTGSVGAITFDTRFDLNTASNAPEFSIGDFDGDGKPDFAVTSNTSGRMSVFRNGSTAGSISLDPVVMFPALISGLATVTADLDGDGITDIATTHQTQNRISFFRNKPLMSISGPGNVCVGSTIALTNGTSGGAWTSSNTAIATVNATSGVVTGVDVGSVTITYCGTAGASFSGNIVTMSVTVNARPAITFTVQPGATARIANRLVYATQSGMSGYVWSVPGVAGTDYMIAAGGGTGDTSVTVKWLSYGAKTVTVNYTDVNGCTAVSPASSVATTLLVPPTVTSVSPAAANVATAVTITGTNFSTTADSNTVYFGATRAAVTAASTTMLNVTVPAGANYKPVFVYNHDNDLAAEALYPFMPEYNNAAYVPGWIHMKPRVQVSTGAIMQDVVLSDIDGDGRPDIVAAAGSANAVRVYRNISAGGSITLASFDAGVNFVVGNNPQGIAVGDIDGDGKPDVVAANMDGNTIGILRNTSVSGTVSFAARMNYATGSNPKGVALGDVDGDGALDVVATNMVDATVSVFHNNSVNGTIAMAGQVVLATGASPRGVALADFNNDGKLDLGVVSGPDASLSVHLNDYPSDTYFAAREAFSLDVSGGSRGLAVGDIDGDGKPDVAAANQNTANIVVLRNTSAAGGAVSFAPMQQFATPNGPQFLAMGDIDGDNKPDLVVSNTNSSRMSVFRNTSAAGSVSFATRIDSIVGRGPIGIAVGDLNADGKPDIVTAHNGAQALTIFENDPVGFITGADSVCVNATIALSDATAGGLWTSSNISVATISSSGVVQGVGAGQAIISYSFSGVATTATINVKPLANAGVITGATSVCQQSAIALSTGAGDGVWSSSNTSVATVNSAGSVAGVVAGSPIISYTVTNSCGSAAATATITVLPLPDPGTITGATAVCAGSVIPLSSGIAGGVWTSENTLVAVAAAGNVTGVAAGTVNISYTVSNSCGDTTAVKAITVHATPPSITGVNVIAPFYSDTLSNAGGPGTWSSSAPVVATINATTGIVAALSPGTTVIRFTNTNGCSADTSLVVSAGNMVCVGQTIVLSNGGVPGGTWASANGSIAKVVASTGVVTGMNAGRVIMYYLLPSGAFRTTTVTVNALSQITGATSVCQNFTSTVVNGTPGGGYWSCLDPQAAINSAGVISGISSGVVTIYYTTTQGCVATRTITVYPTAPITGVTNTVCASQTIALTNALAGGSWSTSSNALATVSNLGIVRGVAAGVPRISYIWPNGCHMTYSVTVNALSQIGGGTAGMCQSSSMALTNATPYGGMWTSSNTAAATVSAAGVVRGSGAGITVISFTSNASGCVATKTVTVNACRERDTTAMQTTDVAVVEQTFDLKLFPNPNTGSFLLRGMVGVADGELVIEVVNMTGQVVYKGQVQMQNGAVDARLDVDAQLPAGMYMLNAVGERDRRSLHFILQR